jgi:hypothetical protein
VRDTSPSPLAATEPFALAAAYHLPADLQTIPAMRIVVRNGFSRDLADLLLAGLTDASLGSNSSTGPSRPTATPAQPSTSREALLRWVGHDGSFSG